MGRAPFPCRGDIGAMPAGVPWGRGGGYPHATQNRPGRALGAFRLPFLTRSVFGPFSGTGTPHGGIAAATRGPTGPRRPGGRPMTREHAPDRAEGLDRARRPKNRFPGFFCAFASSVAVIPGRPWTFSTTPAPTARGRTRAASLDDLTHDDRGRADHTEGARRAAGADGQGRPHAGERMAGTPSAETQGPIAGNCVPNHVPKTGVYGDFLTGQKSVFKKFGTFFGTRPPKPTLQMKTGHRVFTR